MNPTAYPVYIDLPEKDWSKFPWVELYVKETGVGERKLTGNKTMTTKKETSNHHHPDVGDKFVDHSGSARILAIADGWAMMRRSNQIPFVFFCNDLMTKSRWRLHCDICKLPRQKT